MIKMGVVRKGHPWDVNRRTAEWYKTIEKANLSEEQVQKLKANVKTRFQVSTNAHFSKASICY